MWLGKVIIFWLGMGSFWRAMAPAVCWAVFVAVIMLVPGMFLPPVLVSVPGIDRAVHFIAYGVLAYLTGTDLYRQRRYRWLRVYYVYVGLVVVVCYSVVLELAQVFVVGRTFSWDDLLANVVGIIIGMGAAVLVVGEL